MKKLILLGLLLCSVVSELKAQTVPPVPVRYFRLWSRNAAAANHAPVGSNIAVTANSGVYTVTSVTYTDAESDARATPLPRISEMVLNGGAFAGSVQSVTYVYFEASGITESGSTYQWFVADDVNGTNASVVSTATTYTPSQTGKYLDVGVTPRSSLGETGTEVRLGYRLIGSNFSPADLSPVIYLTPASGAAIATNTYWQNLGSIGNMIKDGAVAIPTYNVTETAVEFTAASSQNLVLINPTPQYVKPIVIWMRIKLKTTANQTWLGISGSHHVRYNGGLVTISGVGVTGTALTTGHWYILRIEISASASSSKLQIDGATEITGIAASTNGVGTTAGKLGAISTGGSQFANCYWSYLIVVNGTVSDPNKALMDTWFANNAPHD